MEMRPDPLALKDLPEELRGFSFPDRNLFRNLFHQFIVFFIVFDFVFCGLILYIKTIAVMIINSIKAISFLQVVTNWYRLLLSIGDYDFNSASTD